MKKVLALALAVVLAFGMMSVSFAAAGDRIDGLSNASIGFSYILADGAQGTLDNIVISSDNTIKIYLDPSQFSWKDGHSPLAVKSNPMTTSNLSGLSVKASWKKGGDFFLSPELKYDSKLYTCYIELKTKKGLNLTGDKDVDGKIVLSYKGEKIEIAIAGLASHEEEAVSDDDDSVWITKNEYFKADGFVKGLEVNFDTDDVVAYMNVFGGKKYYLWIEEDVQSKDEEIIAKYDSIEAVYHAYYSSNVNVPTTVVQFDLDDKYYVYNQDGKYLGMSDEKLPLASVYYLSSQKLEAFAGDDTAPATAPTDNLPPALDNPASGGDDDASANANDNPGTGSNGFMNVAVAAGLVALAAAGISLKK